MEIQLITCFQIIRDSLRYQKNIAGTMNKISKYIYDYLFVSKVHTKYVYQIRFICDKWALG
jgi:hypothetical protein